MVKGCVQGRIPPPHSVQHSHGGSGQAIEQENDINNVQIRKEELNYST